jgi:hypothetical protein
LDDLPVVGVVVSKALTNEVTDDRVVEVVDVLPMDAFSLVRAVVSKAPTYKVTDDHVIEIVDVLPLDALSLVLLLLLLKHQL